MNLPALVLIVALATALSSCSDAASPKQAAAPTVLVQVQPVRQGSAPELIVGYGQADVQARGSLAVNVLSAGQVTRLDVAPGDHVRAGQRLATFAISPAEKGSYQQAQNAVLAADAQFAQTERLFKDALATQDQREQARKAAADAHVALQALRLSQAGRGTFALTAPLDGTVSGLSAGVADVLAAGATVLTLASDRGVVARIGVEPGTLPKPGDAATLHPLGAGEDVRGRVVRVGDALDPASRLIDVDVQPQGPLLLGMNYKAALEIGQRSGWIVPRASVMTDVEAAWVFQVADGKASKVRVEVLGQVGDNTVVQGRLADGHPVVVVGASQLEDGMGVRLSDQVMSK